MTNKKEQIDFLDMIDDGDLLKLSSSIIEDDITREVSKVFDYEFKGSVTEEIHIPNFPKEFQIGLIVGSSGSGKSTILHNVFGKEKLLIGNTTRLSLRIFLLIKRQLKNLVR